jgi:non-specific serine/threonine protein kinase
MAFAWMRPGEYELAQEWLAKALSAYRDLGNREGIATALAGLGATATLLGHHDQAASLLAESLELREAMGNKWGTAASLGSLAVLAVRDGNFSRARVYLAKSLALRQDIGDRGGMAWCLEEEARMTAAEGQAERAARLLGAASALRASVQALMDTNEQSEYEQQLALLRERMGSPAFEAAWVEGQAMPLGEAVSLALAATRTAS